VGASRLVRFCLQASGVFAICFRNALKPGEDESVVGRFYRILRVDCTCLASAQAQQ
jgi:hypothetical protein